MTKLSILAFLEEQFAAPVPLVTADLSGKIVVVTGSNTGLGFEAAKHFSSMGSLLGPPTTNIWLSSKATPFSSVISYHASCIRTGFYPRRSSITFRASIDG